MSEFGKSAITIRNLVYLRSYFWPYEVVVILGDCTVKRTMTVDKLSKIMNKMLQWRWIYIFFGNCHFFILFTHNIAHSFQSNFCPFSFSLRSKMKQHKNSSFINANWILNAKDSGSFGVRLCECSSFLSSFFPFLVQTKQQQQPKIIHSKRTSNIKRAWKLYACSFSNN